MSDPAGEQRVDSASPPVGTADGYAEVAGSVARSGLWSVFGQLAALVAALVATPFTIRLLGPARYALLSLLQSVQSWVGIADFGMGAASTRFAGERHAQGDGQGEARATSTSIVITTGATLVVAAAFVLAAPFVVKSVLHITGGLAGPGETPLRLVAIVCVTTALLGTVNTPLLVRLRWRELTLIMAISTDLPATRGSVTGMLELRILRWLGVISYGLYLWHVPILSTIERVHRVGFGLLLVLTASLTTVVAAASYRLVEAPLIRASRRRPI